MPGPTILDSLGGASLGADTQSVQFNGGNYVTIPFNALFTKASSCLAGPHDDVVRPAHVQLLDYEIELGLVMKRSVTKARAISVVPTPKAMQPSAPLCGVCESVPTSNCPGRA